MGILDWADGATVRPSVTGPVRVLGIDLGTTNSVVTDIIWDPASGDEPVVSILDVPQAIHPAGEVTRELVPSVVALIDGHEYVGEGAHRLRAHAGQAGLEPDRTIWWEQKNWIGTQRSYPTAAEGYRSPRDITARILEHLRVSALDATPHPIDRIVVTVPASFQLTQRKDTVEAARMAGLELAEGDLFDEPIAAFLDYFSHEDLSTILSGARTRIMVVDFGGGTCDVALLIVENRADGVRVARRNVSRFHRIGGGDLDMAIANEVLLPRLLEENGVKPFELNFTQKQRNVFPALASLAEQLKKKVAAEFARLRGLGKAPEDESLIRVELPVPLTISSGNVEIGDLTLSKPSLTLAELRSATAAFLATDHDAPTNREYYSITSIFAPVHDAMSRAEWTPLHLDAILVVGGSSMNPLVTDALRSAFPNSTMLMYADPLDAQRAISRGAAIHALHRTVFGRSPILPTLAEDVSIMTTEGPSEIVAAGTSLPFPAEGDSLRIPDLVAIPTDTPSGTLPLSLEFLSGERTFHTETVDVEGPVAEDDPITLEVRIDQDQVMRIAIEVQGSGAAQRFQVDLDNPFAVTANPNETRERILELTEQAKQPGSDARRLIRRLAELHLELRERERARQLLEVLLPEARPGERLQLLNIIAHICKDMGDTEKYFEYLRKAVDAGDADIAGFNLALGLHNAGQDTEALTFIDRSIAADDSAPSRVLKGDILTGLKRTDEAHAEFETALAMLDGDFTTADEFTLGWVRSAARRLKQPDVVDAITAAIEQLRARKQAQGAARGSGDRQLPKLGNEPD
jgi:molecular chaperone DnaK